MSYERILLFLKSKITPEIPKDPNPKTQKTDTDARG